MQGGPDAARIEPDGGEDGHATVEPKHQVDPSQPWLAIGELGAVWMAGETQLKPSTRLLA
jgi:hypothetical protein